MKCRCETCEALGLGDPDEEPPRDPFPAPRTRAEFVEDLVLAALGWAALKLQAWWRERTGRNVRR